MPSEQTPEQKDLRIYRGLTLSADNLPKPKQQQQHLAHIPPPPPWRAFGLSAEDGDKDKEVELKQSQESLGKIDPRALGFVASKEAVELVNAALCLRRPLLIEGNPGSGKTSLAYAVAVNWDYLAPIVGQLFLVLP